MNRCQGGNPPGRSREEGRWPGSDAPRRRRHCCRSPCSRPPGPPGLVTTGSNASAAADPHTLPDGTRVPAQAVKAPASLTPPHTWPWRPRQRPAGRVDRLGQRHPGRGPGGVPARRDRHRRRRPQLPPALAAGGGDRPGRVRPRPRERQHADRPGHREARHLRPRPRRQARHREIRDTDAGQYDQDSRYDRAVGPMQFIPSTWAIVGVDADNDGQRNPQDIYDAALASAVYLCSGPDDLVDDGRASGRRSTATTTASGTSTSCWRSSRPTSPATTARCRTARRRPASPSGHPLVNNATHHRHHRHATHHGHHGHHTPTSPSGDDQPTIGSDHRPDVRPDRATPPASPSRRPGHGSRGRPTVTLPTLPVPTPDAPDPRRGGRAVPGRRAAHRHPGVHPVRRGAHRLSRARPRGSSGSPLNSERLFDQCVSTAHALSRRAASTAQ